MSEYENSEMDFHYENSGANMSEMQHAKDCEWIYDNCTCGLIETLDYDVEDNGDWQMIRQGDLTNAFMETIGTMWDSEEETHMTHMDIRAINYFLYIAD